MNSIVNEDNQEIVTKLPTVYKLPLYYRLPWRIILLLLGLFFFLLILLNIPDGNNYHIVPLISINFNVGPIIIVPNVLIQTWDQFTYQILILSLIIFIFMALLPTMSFFSSIRKNRLYLLFWEIIVFFSGIALFLLLLIISPINKIYFQNLNLNQILIPLLFAFICMVLVSIIPYFFFKRKNNNHLLFWETIIILSGIILFFLLLLESPIEKADFTFVPYLSLNINSVIGYPFLIEQVWGQLFILRYQILALLFFLFIFMVVLPRVPYLSFLRQKSLSLGLGLLFFFLILAIFASVIAPYSYDQRTTNCVDNPYCRQAPPSDQHLMGTTTLGYDLYSRILYGAMIPFQMCLIASSIAVIIGIPLGLMSGYYGGTIDRILNAFMDLLYSFPSILLAITLSLFLVNIPYVGSDVRLRFVIVVGFSVGVVYIPTFFKIVRGQVFQVKQMAYVEAPGAIGATDYAIQSRYILPNVLASPLSLIPFPMVDAILTGAALAFLGLGIQPPAADWGLDLSQGQKLVLIAPWWITFPGIMIFLLAFAFAIIGDALNDKFNPLLSLEETTLRKN